MSHNFDGRSSVGGAAGIIGAESTVEKNTSRSLYRSPFLQDVVPFLTSLSLHAAILCVGLLTYKAIQIVATKAAEPLIVPDSPMLNVGDVPDTGTRWPGIADQLSRFAQDQSVESTHFDGRSDHSGIQDQDSSGDGSQSAADFVIGLGNQSRGHGPGGGSGDGGLLGRFGFPSKGMKGIFGDGVNPSQPLAAHRIIYVCDSSGSMLNKMGALKAELGKAVLQLKPTQAFNVIFFSAEAKPETFGGALLAATPENKSRALRFLNDVTAGGSTDPLPGLELAFKQQPELIYLLTDGDFPDNDLVLARIRQLNKEKKVRVHTIAFVGMSDTDVNFKALLKQVAKENDGNFKQVSPDDL